MYSPGAGKMAEGKGKVLEGLVEGLGGLAGKGVSLAAALRTGGTGIKSKSVTPAGSDETATPNLTSSVDLEDAKTEYAALEVKHNRVVPGSIVNTYLDVC
jgi:hypothetical protein